MSERFFRAMPRHGNTVLLIGAVGIVIGAIGIRFAHEPSWIRFFDNLHWTFGTITAAILAWMSFRKATPKDMKTLRWFAIGLTGYATGQVFWDVQTFFRYAGFPAPSDLFYLWLGPCVAAGLLHAIHTRTKPTQRKTIWLDATTLSVAVLTLVLVIYLPKRGDTELFPLLILITYPVSLFIPTCLGLIMIPVFRLRLTLKYLLFLPALAVTGWSWMKWNSMALDGTTIDGAWFNISFSVAILAMGAGVATWKFEQSSSPKYDRLCEGLLRMLPLLTVVTACAAVIFSHSMTTLPRIVSISVDVGALTVILLAMVRQSMLLKERDQLLAAQEAVRQNEERLRFMLETCPIAVRIAKGSDHQVIFSNRSYAELINVETGNVTSVDPGSYYANPEDYEDVFEQLSKTGSITNKLLELKIPGVGTKWVLASYFRVSYLNEHSVIGWFYDITEKKKSEELIWTQANFDPLTGLPNRRMFRDRLEQELRKAHRTALPLALMLLDLDGFKEVNDTLGHDMGDILLKDAAQRLNSCVRETDTVARLGGDEFTVIMGELDEPGSVERVAQDILQKLAEPFHLGIETAYITASIGITLYPEDAAGIDELLKNADQAMYAAKNQGHNRYNYFTPSMQAAAQARMRLANDLRGALADNQFRVVYQPIMELATGAIHKAEALIRWQHPARGLIGPDEFIPIAEDTGMIVDIGDWVFREAARQAGRWRASRHAEFQISVNTSPAQFYSEGNSLAAWSYNLQKLGLPGQSIAVEITEGLLLDASAAITDQLLAFRDAGIQVSIDDFGTGYSSLSYLKKFDIDYLKIDRSFVRNLTPDSDDMALCEAIIVMAHKLGMKVIAEGVETEEQRDLLAAAGCDYWQGYLFSKPVPAEEFERLLDRQSK